MQQKLLVYYLSHMHPSAFLDAEYFFIVQGQHFCRLSSDFLSGV